MTNLSFVADIMCIIVIVIYGYEFIEAYNKYDIREMVFNAVVVLLMATFL